MSRSKSKEMEARLTKRSYTVICLSFAHHHLVRSALPFCLYGSNRAVRVLSCFLPVARCLSLLRWRDRSLVLSRSPLFGWLLICRDFLHAASSVLAIGSGNESRGAP